jgi:hypothetical protein
MTEKKKEIYKQIKVGGFALYIPVILATGPMAGHFAGEYLKTKFNAPGFVSMICIAVGFIAGGIETARTIKLISKISDS